MRDIVSDQLRFGMHLPEKPFFKKLPKDVHETALENGSRPLSLKTGGAVRHDAISFGWLVERGAVFSLLNSQFFSSGIRSIGEKWIKNTPTEVGACSVKTEITADAAALPADTWCRDGVAALAAFAHRACLVLPFPAADHAAPFAKQKPHAES